MRVVTAVGMKRRRWEATTTIFPWARRELGGRGIPGKLQLLPAGRPPVRDRGEAREAAELTVANSLRSSQGVPEVAVVPKPVDPPAQWSLDAESVVEPSCAASTGVGHGLEVIAGRFAGSRRVPGAGIEAGDPSADVEDPVPRDVAGAVAVVGDRDPLGPLARELRANRTAPAGVARFRVDQGPLVADAPADRHLPMGDHPQLRFGGAREHEAERGGGDYRESGRKAAQPRTSRPGRVREVVTRLAVNSTCWASIRSSWRLKACPSLSSSPLGGVPERLNGAVSKTVDGGNVVREFESLPLRLIGREVAILRALLARVVR